MQRPARCLSVNAGKQQLGQNQTPFTGTSRDIVQPTGRTPRASGCVIAAPTLNAQVEKGDAGQDAG